MAVKLHDFANRCFVCGVSSGPYSGFHRNRFCTCKIERFSKVGNPDDFYLTRLPMPEDGSAAFKLIPPLLRRSMLNAEGGDDTAIEGGGPAVAPGWSRALPDFWAVDLRDSSHDKAYASGDLVRFDRAGGLLPFSDVDLRCGNAMLYDWGQVRERCENHRATVLDLSAYHWSHTLKDPRSLAIVNVAKAHGIQHLALWSAGNAALSLAIAARLRNLLDVGRGGRPPLTVHVLVGKDTASSITSTLHAHGAVVQKVQTKSPLSSDAVYKLVNDHYHNTTEQYRSKASKGQYIDKSRYWEVTGGWDGVGTLMYYLLFCQVIQEVQPDYMVLPCGTGSLAIGAVMAAEACTKHLKPDRPFKVVLAVPTGKNSSGLTRLAPHAKPGRSDIPIAPKLAFEHTALKPCLIDLIQEGKRQKRLDKPEGMWVNGNRNVVFVDVDLHDQDYAGNAIRSLHRFGQAVFPFEPSSLLAYAAARAVSKNSIKTEHVSMCIVNTGCGLMTSREIGFLGQLRYLKGVKGVGGENSGGQVATLSPSAGRSGKSARGRRA